MYELLVEYSVSPVLLTFITFFDLTIVFKRYLIFDSMYFRFIKAEVSTRYVFECT